MTWNVGKPAMGNTIAADIPDIEENLNVLGPYFNIWVPATQMTALTTNGGAAGAHEYTTNDIMMEHYAFDDGTEEYVAFNILMPEYWNKSTIKAKFFWGNAAGASGADTVEWEIAGGALSNDDAIDAALGTGVAVSDAVITDGDLHVTAATGAITVGGTPALGDLIHFKVSRNVGGTDDMVEDAWLFGVWLQGTMSEEIAAW